MSDRDFPPAKLPLRPLTPPPPPRTTAPSEWLVTYSAIDMSDRRRRWTMPYRPMGDGEEGTRIVAMGNGSAKPGSDLVVVESVVELPQVRR